MPIVCPLKFAALFVLFLMPNPGMIAMSAAALLPTWTKLSSCLTFRVVDLSPESTVVSISSVSDTVTVAEVLPSFRVTLVLRLSPPPKAMPVCLYVSKPLS